MSSALDGRPLDAGQDPAGSGPVDPDALAEVVELLAARAQEVDVADRLPASHLAALAELGLNGMVISPADGGLGMRPPQVRRVLRQLGSGCGATAFAFAQHHGTIGNLASSTNRPLRDRWLPALVDDTLAGIAYAHVRRPGAPVLRAEPIGAGDDVAWEFDGQAPWVTSWGLAGVFGVAALTNDGRLVWALVPGREVPGLRLAQRFDLSVFGATATVALAFDRYRVSPDHVLNVVDVETWAARDRLLAARPNPLCLGIGDRALHLLESSGGFDGASELAAAWGELAARAEEQSRAVDEGRAELADVARARAETVLMTQHLTTVLLARVGGRAMERSHPAQRLHREAGFYVVQAQNAAGRDAMLAAASASLLGGISHPGEPGIAG